MVSSGVSPSCGAIFITAFKAASVPHELLITFPSRSVPKITEGLPSTHLIGKV
jgi:hypothetical protein